MKKLVQPTLQSMVAGFACVGAIMALSWLSLVATAGENLDYEAIANRLATLFRSARAVISEHQTLINDASKGDKGLTGEKVIDLTRQNYQKATNQELRIADSNSLEGKSIQAMLDSIKEVMDKAQALINRSGMGFKGFLPAVFAKQVADSFRSKMTGLADIKLTAPKDYVRNRANTPDEWESKVIETIFKAKDYPKGKSFFEAGEYKGKKAFRLIIPEYYASSCLSCHGEPKGERDITGGKKEGGKEGELGGAISVMLYLQ